MVQRRADEVPPATLKERLLPENSAWRFTGASKFRRGIFGRPVLIVEEIRRVFRPINTGHTPANWSEQTRWRRAAMRDLPFIKNL